MLKDKQSSPNISPDAPELYAGHEDPNLVASYRPGAGLNRVEGVKRLGSGA